MKKALDIILIYLLVLIVGILGITFLYTFYNNMLNFVAGSDSKLLNNEIIIKSFVYVAQGLLLVICPIISYYRIRRPSGVPQTLGYIFIVLLTWGLIFPSVSYLDSYVKKNYVSSVEDIHLSKDYFRKIDKKVYYFTKDFESENNNVATSSALVIDTSEYGKIEYKTVRDMGIMEFNKSAKPYKDILVKQNFYSSRITLPVALKNLIEKLSKCYELNLYYLLYLLSFVLVISSVYAMSNFFNWKLLNAVLVFFIAISLVSVNSEADLALFNMVKQFFIETKPFQFLSKYIYESFLFVFNVLCSLVFITLGIIKFVIHRHSNKN